MDRSNPELPIHKVFAENLRRQTLRFASIAELCRMTGINRPQFNRYLSGQNLPNPRTMARLCAVLGVPEARLFETPGSGLGLAASPMSPAQMAQALDQAGQVVYGQLLREVAAGRPVELISGYYNLYIPYVTDPRHVLRLLIKVSRSNGQVLFTRRTVLRDTARPDGGIVIGRHVGLVLADDNGLVMLARNRVFPFELSMLRVMNGMSTGTAPRMGIALLRTPEGQYGCRMCLEWCGANISAAKAALRRLGVLPLDDASISPLVRQLMVAEDGTRNAGVAAISDREYYAIIGGPAARSL